MKHAVANKNVLKNRNTGCKTSQKAQVFESFQMKNPQHFHPFFTRTRVRRNNWQKLTYCVKIIQNSHWKDDLLFSKQKLFQNLTSEYQDWMVDWMTALSRGYFLLVLTKTPRKILCIGQSAKRTFGANFLRHSDESSVFIDWTYSFIIHSLLPYFGECETCRWKKLKDVSADICTQYILFKN